MDFEDIHSDDKSSVWRHFFRAKDKNTAKCKQCNKILKSMGSSTSGLHKHLKTVHKTVCDIQTESIPQPQQEPSTASSSKKMKLTDYYQSYSNPSTETRVSRMVALDGITCRAFANSKDLRDVFNKSGYKLPKSANSIREMVFKNCEEKKKDLLREVQKLKSGNEKFAISFDEWTSNRNRRYLSLILHSQSFDGPVKFKNLGLLRVYGSLPAEKCIEQIKQKLAYYKLSLEHDIIGQTADGCSMMVKIGRLLKSLHQKCIAHAIQLAISDVFYKKPQDGRAIEQTNVVHEQNPVDRSDDEDEEISLAQLAQRLQQNVDTIRITMEENNAEEDGVVFTEELSNLQLTLKYHDLLGKVRKVVKLFNYSPTKNDDILQKYVRSEFGKEYSLILDVKTRWSSIADMLARFLKLKLCITRALLDLKSEMAFSNEEWDKLDDIHEVLDIIKTIVGSLCHREASLLTADVAIKFALRKLTELNSSLSTKMASQLKKRYSDRRLIQASTLSYLTNLRKYFDDIGNDDLFVFPRLTSDEMCQDIMKNLNQEYNETSVQDETEGRAELDTSTLSKKEELNLEL